MTRGRGEMPWGPLRAVFEDGPVAGLSDGELLERFVDRRSEAAFEAIVRRHGPMVRDVCQRVLRDPHDADDAAQATFLVLARRAGTVRSSGSLASWLYGVARRVSARLRADCGAPPGRRDAWRFAPCFDRCSDRPRALGRALPGA